MATTASAATTAVRKTAKGEKVYIHTTCSCAKINGRTVKGLETVADGQTYAADNGLEVTFCKTSEQVTEQVTEDFELVLDNRDQFGAQRRRALAAIVEAVGAEIASFTGLKNKHRTGNDAFHVVVTKAPVTLEQQVTDFFDAIEAAIEEVITEAKAEGLAEGWDSNTRQKHWKNTARAFIVAQGAEAAAKLA